MQTTLVLSLGLIAALSISGSPKQTTTQANRSVPQSLDGLPTVDLSEPSSDIHSSSDPELNRAHRYDFAGISPLIGTSDDKEVDRIITVHVTNDPIPSAKSTLIVEGLVMSSKAHLSSNRGSIYSTFELIPERYLKGQPGLPVRSLKLERAGGVAIYPDGRKKLISAMGFGLPRISHRYLLFLQAAQDDSYRIVTGYMIDGDHVLALDQQGASLNELNSAQLMSKVLASM